MKSSLPLLFPYSAEHYTHGEKTSIERAIWEDEDGKGLGNDFLRILTQFPHNWWWNKRLEEIERVRECVFLCEGEGNREMREFQFSWESKGKTIRKEKGKYIKIRGKIIGCLKWSR